VARAELGGRPREGEGEGGRRLMVFICYEAINMETVISQVEAVARPSFAPTWVTILVSSAAKRADRKSPPLAFTVPSHICGFSEMLLCALSQNTTHSLP
jgi:hypothetical protein